MRRARLMAGWGIGVAAVLGASCAFAAPAGQIVMTANDFASPNPPPTAAPGRTLEWDSKKGRWGLRLGMEPHYDRDPSLRDLSPGLYYKLTPRLHIGGAVTLAPDNGDGFEPQRLATPQAPNPRVRLETTFKF